jgi:hypothetical protein
MSRRLGRRQKVRLAILGSAVGTALLVGLGLFLQNRQDTDLQSSQQGVTSAFQGEGASGAPPIRFHDVAGEMGIDVRHGPGPRGRTLPEDTGSGIAWGDYDGDGDFDLYVVGIPGQLSGEAPQDGHAHLYRNDGERFVDVTAEAAVANEGGFGMGAGFADFDGDGHVDLYVTNYGPNRLYRNKGDGSFEEVGRRAGVDDPSWSTGMAWGDLDRDGDLDLYVCNYMAYDVDVIGGDISVASGGAAYQVPFTLNPNAFDPVPNRLYLNRGDGTFEDVAERLGVADRGGRSLTATLVDLDGDGWLDLYVNNDVSPNKLFRSLGVREGRLEVIDLSTVSGTADPRGSMGLSVAEIGAMVNRADDLPDMFITHWVAQENAFYVSVRAPGGGFEYRDMTRRLRLGEGSLDTVGWGCALVDLDADGRVDIALANGSTLEDKRDPTKLVPEPLRLLWNSGTQFIDVSARAGPAFARPHQARGLAACDFDQDGDIDFALSCNRGRPLLLRNDTETTNRSLTVRLEAPAALCFGARVTTESGDVVQHRWYGADVGFLGTHAPDLLFGLGVGTSAKVTVRWMDGTTTTNEAAPAGLVKIRHPGP